MNLLSINVDKPELSMILFKLHARVTELIYVYIQEITDLTSRALQFIQPVLMREMERNRLPLFEFEDNSEPFLHYVVP